MHSPRDHHRRRLRTLHRVRRLPSVVARVLPGVAALGLVLALAGCAQVQTSDDPVINGSGGAGGAGGAAGPGSGGRGGTMPPPTPTGVSLGSGTTTVSSPDFQMEVSVGGPVGKGRASSPEFTLDYDVPSNSER